MTLFERMLGIKKTLKINKCSNCYSNFVRLRIPSIGPSKIVYKDGSEKLVRGYWVECFDCGKTGKTTYTKEEAIRNWNENR